MTKQRMHPFEERIKRIEKALEQKANLEDVEDGASDLKLLEDQVEDLYSQLEELREEVEDLQGQLADAESRIDELENEDWP